MAVQAFIILLLVGLVLVGAEIFVPGAVLGIIGGLALLGAMVLGFVAFPGWGGAIAVGIVLLVGLAVALWIVLFPRSRLGRNMTVSQDLAASKAPRAGLEALLGQEGEAVSDLRPGGFAAIGGRRVDVVTQGGMISKGARVRVVRVEGMRVVVERAESPAGA